MITSAASKPRSFTEWLRRPSFRRHKLIYGWCATDAVIIVLLSIHICLLAWMAYRNSPTFDEVAHLPAGISIWTLGRFDLYSVNPPLVRSLAALPAVAFKAKTDWSRIDEDPYSRPEFGIGRNFLSANGPAAFHWYTFARWACIPLSVIGAYSCYCWSRAVYGVRAALLALILWCFSPSLLGHGSLITPDVGAAAMGVTCGYNFRCWLINQSWSRALWAGITLGLAELTKMTWIVLFPLWTAIYVLYAFSRAAPTGARKRLLGALQLVMLLICALELINLGYRFSGSFQPLGEIEVESTLFRGRDTTSENANRFAGRLFSWVPIPLPADYVRGIDIQQADFEKPHWSYLGGTWRSTGWWYFYFYALALKSTHGEWLLGVLALSCAVRRRPSSFFIEQALMLLPAACVLYTVSSRTEFTRHMRYVIPAMPFVIVWISQAASSQLRHGSVYRILLRVATAWLIGSCLFAFPHELAYFNEMAGGALSGPRYLVNSNIDWGQDLGYLRRWSDAHREARPFFASCFGLVTLAQAGIEARPAPPIDIGKGRDVRHAPRGAEGLKPGWYAVSVNHLIGDPQSASVGFAYTYFARFRPIARAGYSIYIYRVTEADILDLDAELRSSARVSKKGLHPNIRRIALADPQRLPLERLFLFDSPAIATRSPIDTPVGRFPAAHRTVRLHGPTRAIHCQTRSRQLLGKSLFPPSGSWDAISSGRSSSCPTRQSDGVGRGPPISLFPARHRNANLVRYPHRSKTRLITSKVKHRAR